MIFQRGPLTDAIIDFLTEALAPRQILVGDGEAPREGGWQGGQPGEGPFTPYIVVNTLNASPRERDPVGRRDTSWSATYSIRSVGALRHQADWTADQSRVALVTFQPRIIDLGAPWSVLKTSYDSLGAVSRNDATDPPYWELVDSASLWLEVHT